jgi:hypothetical protein
MIIIIMIFSVLAITATRLLGNLILNTDLNNFLDMVDFSKRGEYDLGVVKFTLCFFE